MRIAASTVELAATQVSFSSTSRSESLKVWIGDEPSDRGGAAASGSAPGGAIRSALPVVAADLQHGAGGATTQDAARADADATAAGDDQGTLNPHDALDLAILLRTFRLGGALSRAAREIRSAYADRGAAGQPAATTAPPAQAQAEAGPAREGWGLRYDASQTTLDYQASTFTARAQVTLSDGRTLDLQAALAMERAQVRSSEVHLRAGDAQVDPLVLNLRAGAAGLAGATSFDLNGDGAKETVAALAPGSAYLALDQNGNGLIDSGAELFGPSTGSGFGELSALDQDRNGWVDEGDPAFSRLRLWSPASGQLSPLAAAGVGALYTAAVATPFDLRTAEGRLLGRVAQTGLFLREDGTAGTIQHVDLTV